MKRTPLYVWDRRASRFYWFRLKVPEPFREQEGGKSMIAYSLGTTDLHRAGILAGAERAKLFAKWEGCAANDTAPLDPHKPSDAEMALQASELGYDSFLKKLSVHRARKKAKASDEEWESYLARLRSIMLKQIRTIEGDGLDKYRAMARRCIERENWLMDCDGEEAERFARLIAESAIDALRVQLERDSGNLSAGPQSGVVIKGKAACAERAAPGETLLELFHAYSKKSLDSNIKGIASVAQNLREVTLFSDYVGRERSVTQISKADVREFRNLLGRTPANRRSKDYRGLSLLDAAKLAAERGDRLMSKSTINRYLSGLSPLFDDLVGEGYAESNPCGGLFFKRVKNEERTPFTTQQLNTLFSSPLYTGFRSDRFINKPGNMRADDWRYWIALIALFTGARVGEIAQLQIADLKQTDDGIWYFHLCHMPDEGQRTKSKQHRPAALHDGILDVGINQFVKRRESEMGTCNAPLFPEMKVTNKLEIGAKASKWFRRYLERIGIKDGRDGLGYHAFRHALADRIRAADQLDEHVAIALGHKLGSTSGGYGKDPQGTVRWMKGIIDKVNFDDLHLGHLQPAK